MSKIDLQPSAIDVDAATFRTALRQLAGAVSVVTTGTGDQRAGLTATSVTSLSAEPPTLLVCINKTSSAIGALLASRRFVINILSDLQQPVADRFAGRGGVTGTDRFAGSDWTVLATGAPALEGALANLDLELETVLEHHSHAIVIGRVKAVRVREETGALLYWRGQYERFDGSPAGAEGI